MEDMVFAEKIRKVRLEKGLTQKEVAERVGMLRNAYTRIETQKRDCPISFLYRVADALEVDPKELI